MKVRHQGAQVTPSRVAYRADGAGDVNSQDGGLTREEDGFSCAGRGIRGRGGARQDPEAMPPAGGLRRPDARGAHTEALREAAISRWSATQLKAVSSPTVASSRSPDCPRDGPAHPRAPRNRRGARPAGGRELSDRVRSHEELLERFLPPPPARVLDVGGGPGAYAAWLAGSGYAVHSWTRFVCGSWCATSHEFRWVGASPQVSPATA